MNLSHVYAEHLQTISARTSRALAHTGYERLAIFAGLEKVAFRDDWHYPFVANPHFLAWIPLTSHPACWVVFEPNAKSRLIYFQPDDYWHQPPADPSGFWVDHFSIDIIAEPEQAKSLLGNLSTTCVIAETPETLGIDSWGFAAINDSALVTELEYHRAVKTAYELDCMRQAQATAVRCHRAAETAFHRGASEYEIHQAYLDAGSLVDQQLPYNSIVGLNEHGAVLHYQLRDRQPPEQSRSFLIDAGASHAGYAADITRTYSRKPGEFEELISALDRAQLSLCDKVRADTDYRQLHLAAHQAIASVLHDFELVNMPADDIVTSGVSSAFFPHGLGHLIGLQVHDCGGFWADPAGTELAKPEGHPFLRLTRTLEPGFVVTIEPGLYFIPALLNQLKAGRFSQSLNWEKVERLLPFGGIRIEDDVCVTTKKPENLTRDAFASNGVSNVAVARP